MAVRLSKTILVLLIIMPFNMIPVALNYECQPQMPKTIVAYGQIRSPDVTNAFNWFYFLNTISVYLSASAIGSIVGALRWLRWHKKHRINKTPVVTKFRDSFCLIPSFFYRTAHAVNLRKILLFQRGARQSRAKPFMYSHMYNYLRGFSMEINPDLLFLIVGWAIGLFSGFLGTIGFDIWKQYQERRKLKNLVKQELTEIRDELDTQMKNTKGDVIQGKGYRLSVFNELRSDVLRKLNVKISRQIDITYSEINNLGGNRLRKECKKVLGSIDDTIRLLDDC